MTEYPPMNLEPILARLTPAQAQILPMLLEPMTEAEIGKRLFRSRETVHTHVRRIYATLNVRSRIELVRLVLQGVVPERYEEVAMLMPNPAFRELKPDTAGSSRA
jgi:DNA-binding NarL/FixJ family response regulator